MNDSVGVCVLQCQQYLLDVVSRLGNGEWSLSKDGFDRAAFDKFNQHDELVVNAKGGMEGCMFGCWRLACT